MKSGFFTPTLPTTANKLIFCWSAKVLNIAQKQNFLTYFQHYQHFLYILYKNKYIIKRA
ncbi:MAG: hypothetical protein AMQ22_02260 [Candidatus Methanofastidiosum methylothiophilum]|uniref:Uncharacterized protein n=1 Tax=Candidatus Methanofastidiosum methylothiophilum TaxID=1705564 RepID=A0A150IIX6_9EURY|nr:MAG: hypothetical protein AMQ22_02260 [Candidatus Methanofastidiosum methylthiophilus]